MKYVESPVENSGDTQFNWLFLAGGINGCPNWQAELCEMLCDLPVVVFNPRRKDFPIHDPSAAKAQISWEFKYLQKCDLVSFWFCKATLCPIVLYELGRYANTNKKIFVGVEPGYARQQDVEIQMSLARPEVTLVYSLGALERQITENIRYTMLTKEHL